jgi:hypothetical protein
MNITIQQVDPFSSLLYDFRKEIIEEDEGYTDYNCIDEDIYHRFNMSEEVWKFSRIKWNKTKFTALHGVFIDGDLACISGSKLYGRNKNYLRVGMDYYVLKRFRKVCRSWLWKPQGLIETSLSEQKNIDYSFVSIYPHNSRLHNWCKALIRGERYGQIGNGNEHIDLLQSYTMEDDTIILNGVPQYILYREESPTPVSYDQFLIELIHNK